MNNDLLSNLDKIHTTELGVIRIKRNLNLDINDVVLWSKEIIFKSDSIILKGKNWYITYENIIITINRYSYTIITAHKLKK